ncbi:histidine phosphatase family protein (plasmid) [Roseobacter denitrificans]|nr:histidine phosphatase family protein [Roseobacter denitrificans]AVL51269.1 histidine phosphatase family protein [Roseobacter denitrificans]SFG47521.1 Phosphohistidine phosphatase SixA [Roseobacter denitrificans OCh 114]
MTQLKISRRSALAGSLSALLFGVPKAARAEVLGRLRAGGHVIYFRHAATTWSGVDRVEWPRARQRLLSEEGIRQSEIIGAAFRDLQIPVGEVLASPFARCRDMAEIAFGRVEERMALIGLLSDEAGRDERAAFLRSLLADRPTDGTNRVVVAHRSNIERVAGARLAEGEAVILNPDGQGAFDVGQTLMPDEWGALAV